jgi:hypothetical protein
VATAMNIVNMAEKEEISLENQEKRGFGSCDLTSPEPRPQIRENPKKT